MKVTIDTIADKCGVSRVTVSRVIANNSNVNPKTRELILDTMSKLNYHSKKLSGLTAQRQNYVIAVMTGDIRRRSSIDVIHSVKSYLADAGYYCVVMEYDSYSYQKEMEILESFCAGCIILAGMEDTQNMMSSPVQRIPVTVIHCNQVWPQFDSVSDNTYKCFYIMAEYLIGLGHRNIVLVNSRSFVSSHYDSEAGYRDAVHKYGLEVRREYMMESDLSQESGSAAGQNILSGLPKATAAICASRSAAYGLIQELLKAGIRVPEQFSVISCGFFSIGNGDSDISAVGASYEKMGIMAAENILSRIKEKSQDEAVSKGAIKKLILDPVLYEGSTTAEAPNVKK